MGFSSEEYIDMCDEMFALINDEQKGYYIKQLYEEYGLDYYEDEDDEDVEQLKENEDER